MVPFPGKFLYHLPLFPIFRKFWLNGKRPERALFIQPKIPEISVRNQMERFRFGPTGIFGTTFAPLQVVHFDRPAHFGRSDHRSSSFRLQGQGLTRITTKCVVAWVGSEQPECTFPLGTYPA